MVEKIIINRNEAGLAIDCKERGGNGQDRQEDPVEVDTRDETRPFMSKVWKGDPEG